MCSNDKRLVILYRHRSIPSCNKILGAQKTIAHKFDSLIALDIYLCYKHLSAHTNIKYRLLTGHIILVVVVFPAVFGNVRGAHYCITRYMIKLTVTPRIDLYVPGRMNPSEYFDL